MKLPALTVSIFERCLKAGLATGSIGAMNSGNVRGTFTTTIPKALRDNEDNAYFVIKNHRDRFKYMSLIVQVEGPNLHIVKFPPIAMTGYLVHEGRWYPVTGEELRLGIIPLSKSCHMSEVES